MAISNKKKTEEPKEQAALTWEIKRAKDLTKEGADGCTIGFDAVFNGITVYGCFYREGKGKNGKDYQMISFPSHKGGDGKYYNYAYVSLSDEQVDAISKDIEKVLEA